jgi:hypothetical protein
MSELRRWSAEGATGEEIALLEAARRVNPSAKAWARARALGAGAAVATATIQAACQGSPSEAARQGSPSEAARQGSPSEAARQGSPSEAARQGSPSDSTTSVAAAAKSGLALVSKMAILSLVGGGVVAGAIAVRATHPQAAPPTHSERAAPRPPPEEPARPSPLPAEPPAAPLPIAPSAAPSAVSAPPSGDRASPVRPLSSSAALSRELEALDLAHRALAAHNPRTALGVLDRYRAQFPDGRLQSEAVLLRVQSLVALGDRAGAQALADSYAVANPGSPYSRRLREIVQGE